MDGIIRRREIVEFLYEGEKRFGVNIQNRVGNRFSPVIIVLEMKLFEKGTDGIFPFFEYGGKIFGTDQISYLTIDKKRVTDRMGFMPAKWMNRIDSALKREYMQQNTYYTIGMFDFGRKEGTSEQGGRRPAVIFKQKGKELLVAPLSTQTNKRMSDIQIILEEGEGNIRERSLVLNEQPTVYRLKKEDETIDLIGILSKEKSEEIAKGRFRSIEIIPLFDEGAQPVKKHVI